MNRKEYNALFDKLDMSPRGPVAGDLLGLCLRTTFHYSGGDRDIPLPVSYLLRLIVFCQKKGFDLDTVIKAMQGK